MSEDPQTKYSPNSHVLIITTCSLHKKQGGGKYYKNADIGSDIPEESRNFLINTRNTIRNLLWSGQLKWQGLNTSELEFNNNLAYGEDFGGEDPSAKYLPAIIRYDGRFYDALGDEGKKNLILSPHHVLFLSGLYGLVRPLEPIQLYSCPVEFQDGKSLVKDIWTKNDGLTHVLVDYVKKHNIKKIFDFTARKIYRDLINWDFLKTDTSADVYHCFSNMAAGDYALTDFGKFIKSYLINASEDDLLKINGDTLIQGVLFTSDDEPSQNQVREELEVIRRAEKEIPQLIKQSLDEITHTLGSTLHEPQQKPHGKDNVRLNQSEWFLALTTEFRKNVFEYQDKKQQGRFFEAITEIAKIPMEPRGDTIKRLTGDFAGIWRYRVGDFRILYLPDPATKTIALLAIRPRGGAYD